MILKPTKQNPTLESWITNPWGLNILEPKPTTYTKDPLVLACVLKKLTDEKNQIYHSLDSSQVAAAITPEIVSYADLVRRHFSKKFMWAGLKSDKPVSDYRARTFHLLESRATSLTEQDKGIMVKLPWFYEEDLAYAELRENYAGHPVQEDPSFYHDRRALNLTHVKTTDRWRGKVRSNIFWFKDKNNRLYNLEVEKKNILFSFLKSLLEINSDVKLETNIAPSPVGGLQSCKLYNFSLYKD